ncbi:MAG: hypothetical protein ACN4G0_10095 [Polyangiales bacterium]
MSLTRKSFLTGSLAVGALAVLEGCGSSDDGAAGSGGSAGTGGSAGSGGTAGSGGVGGSGGAGGGGAGGDGGAGGGQDRCTVGGQGPSDTHGHEIEIPQADIDDPQDREYSSTGGTHPHTVAVTAAQYAELAANGSVTVTSNDTHAHTWVLTCG